MDEMEELNKKIRTIMENRELPEGIRKEIENAYREYQEFYDENIRGAVNIPSAQNFFEEEQYQAKEQIKNNYKQECMDKAEDIIKIIQRFENSEETIENNKKENYLEDEISSIEDNKYEKVKRIIDIVLDSINETRNQLFRQLSLYTIDENQKEQIDQEINNIKNRAMQRIENTGIEEFNIDQKQITNEVLNAYEEYTNENIKGINTEENGTSQEKSAQQEFKESLKYDIPQEEMDKILKENEQKQKEQKQKETKSLIDSDFLLR